MYFLFTWTEDSDEEMVGAFDTEGEATMFAAENGISPFAIR